MRRDELTRHIDRSRQVQRRVVQAAAVVALAAVVLLIAGAPTAAWLGVAALAGIVGGSGVWITQGHIADFRRQLRNLKDPAVNSHLEKVYGTIRETSADKQKEIERYRRLYGAGGSQPGDASRGRAVYNKVCAQCHTLFDTGGCSCEQIVEQLGLGQGPLKFGCPADVMEAWVASVE